MENRIEEDIKIIENFINWLTIDFEYDSGNEIKTIEHILSDYKRVLKENEELIETYKSEKKMKNEYVKLYQVLLLKENVIPVQKVKDKIEELDKKEQKLQNSISVEEREEYSDANIS